MGGGDQQDRGRGALYSDGSLLEGGNVGGGTFVVQSGGNEEEVEAGVGDIATVWDGEIVGKAQGLAREGASGPGGRSWCWQTRKQPSPL